MTASVRGATDVYEFGGLDEHGPQVIDGSGTTVVTGSEVDTSDPTQSRTRVLGPDGAPLFDVVEENVSLGASDQWKCWLQDADGTTLGGYEGRQRLAAYELRILDPDGATVARVESVTGGLRTAVYHLSNGFLGELRLAITQDGETIGSVRCGNMLFARRAEVAADGVDHRRLVVAYCLAFHVVNGYTVYD